MDSLPIYNTLLTKIEDNNKITKSDKDSIITNINNNPDTHEIVFVIIKYYQIKNSNDMSYEPYNSKFLKTKNGYKFDINLLPVKLIKMLVEFYIIHNKSKENL